jgi:hypothetical protein
MFDLTDFKNIVSNFVYYLDDVNGYKLFRMIEKEDIKNIERDEENMGAYLALEFLVIPFLSTKEIFSLLKENLSAGLKTEDIDLTERITKKLLGIDLSDRDNCKKELKTALINNKEELIGRVTVGPNKKIGTVSDWIKDYIGQIGSKNKIALNEAQYFFQKPYFVKLKETEKNILKKIFMLYKLLNASSLTPEGFEDDLLLVDKQGRLITTNKGKVVVLYDSKNEEKKVAVGASLKAISSNLSEQEKQVIELKKMASQYPAGSLEHKAVVEELEKLRKKTV